MLEPPPPNMPDAGLFAVPLAPPNIPPDAGAVVPLLGAPKGVVVVGFAAPKRPPEDEGVAALLLPNTPAPEGVAAPEGGLEDEPPPNKPPAGFCAPAPLCCPNTEPVLPEGVALLPAEAPPCDPKENDVPELPGAEPKRPPAAGAEEVALFDGALVELGAPKANDMFAVTGSIRCLELC